MVDIDGHHFVVLLDVANSSSEAALLVWVEAIPLVFTGLIGVLFVSLSRRWVHAEMIKLLSLIIIIAMEKEEDFFLRY